MDFLSSLYGIQTVYQQWKGIINDAHFLGFRWACRASSWSSGRSCLFGRLQVFNQISIETTHIAQVDLKDTDWASEDHKHLKHACTHKQQQASGDFKPLPTSFPLVTSFSVHSTCTVDLVAWTDLTVALWTLPTHKHNRFTLLPVTPLKLNQWVKQINHSDTSQVTS